METLGPMMELYRIVSSESYSNALKVACLKVLKYEGSIFSSYIIPLELATQDEVYRIMRFLTNTNFGKIARYMVVLANPLVPHQSQTVREWIARSLMNALDRAIRAMPLEDLEISDSDVRSFFIRDLHMISHWASTHLVWGGLYMPSQKLISGLYHWVGHPNRQKKIDPDDDIRHWLYSAPTYLVRYYLVTAIAQAHISSPG